MLRVATQRCAFSLKVVSHLWNHIRRIQSDRVCVLIVRTIRRVIQERWGAVRHRAQIVQGFCILLKRVYRLVCLLCQMREVYGAFEKALVYALCVQCGDEAS